MFFLRGAQLVLRSSVLTVLDLDEVNVTLKNAEIFGSVMSGEGGSASGWRCCPLPLFRTHPRSFIASLLLFSFHGDGRNQKKKQRRQ